MPLAEQAVVDRYAHLSKTKRAHVLRLYSCAKLTGTILFIIGVVAVLLILISHEVAKNSDYMYQIVYLLCGEYMDNAVEFGASLIGITFFLLSWLVPEAMHWLFAWKYSYYSKSMGKYADKIDAIKTHRYK